MHGPVCRPFSVIKILAIFSFSTVCGGLLNGQRMATFRKNGAFGTKTLIFVRKWALKLTLFDIIDRLIEFHGNGA